MKPLVFLSSLVQMTCVSYTILVAVFCSVEFFTGAVGPSQPREMLLLLLMAAMVSLWNMLIRSRLSDWRLLLLRYAGGTAIVLTIGISCGHFIPLNLPTILIVCAIVAVVFLGTWLYLCVAARVEAAEINRGLQERGQRRRTRP